jgi:hypothetical protein
LHDGAEAQFVAQRVGDAVGLGDVFGEIAGVLAGDRFAHAAHVGDACFFGLGGVGVYGESIRQSFAMNSSIDRPMS